MGENVIVLPSAGFGGACLLPYGTRLLPATWPGRAARAGGLGPPCSALREPVPHGEDLGECMWRLARSPRCKWGVLAEAPTGYWLFFRGTSISRFLVYGPLLLLYGV